MSEKIVGVSGAQRWLGLPVFQLAIVAAFSVLISSGCRTAGKDATAIGLYEPFSVCLASSDVPSNPFDPEMMRVDGIFTHEQGLTLEVPAFWYQAYNPRALPEGDPEHLDAVGEPGFRLRFTPRWPGRYEWHWRITRGKEIVERPGGAILAGDGLSHGFIVLSPSPRYLMASNGEPLFLIGQNVAWTTERAPLADILRYIDELADSGQNCMRLWLCTWGFGFEHEQIGRYDLQRAWRLDQIVEHARKRGVYIILVLENAHDIREDKSPYTHVMASPGDFFTSELLRNAYKNRMRYAAARWGYSTSILAWEFFNEMEYTVLSPLELDNSVRDKYFAPWLEEMAAAMTLYDAHSHLLTNSLATDRLWDEMYEFPWMAIAQQHTYLNPWEQDAAEKVIVALEEISEHRKPVLMGEFGGAPANVAGSSENLVNENDPEGVHLHQSLWASAMVGAAGTPLNWWWDTYIRPNKLNYHYAALNRFLKGTPWLDPTLRSTYFSANGARVLMLRGEGWGRLWAQNRLFTWQTANEPAGVAPVEAFSMPINDFEKGIYRIEWWDTQTGRVTATRTVRCDSAMTIEIPSFQRDIAAKITRVADGKATAKSAP